MTPETPKVPARGTLPAVAIPPIQVSFGLCTTCHRIDRPDAGDR